MSLFRDEYVQKRLLRKLCKYVIIIITLSYDEQMKIYLKTFFYIYYIDAKLKKTNIIFDFLLLCSILIFVHETHFVC